MSRWSNNPQRKISWVSRGCLGLAFTQRHIAAAYLDAGTQPPTLHWSGTEVAPAVLFRGAPAPALAAQLATVIQRVCRPLQGRYSSVQVALPDPAVHVTTLSLDELPKGKAALGNVLRWRIAKELGLEAETLACSWQALDVVDGKHVMLVLAVEQVWRDCIEHALRLAGMPSEVMDMAMCHRVNRFHALNPSTGAGGMVAIDADTYAIAAWDAQARLQLVRGWWRDPDHGVDALLDSPRAADADLIARDVEHTLRAFAQRCTTPLGAVHVYGTTAQLRRVLPSLQARLGASCVAWLATEGLDGTLSGLTTNEPGIEAAIAAACAR